ncbi:Sigma factor AlgU regulatory protein MucB [Thalassocella blandensis]|nr:Sigma factor AlgU regulatory protein MucB [Thalassocella blandensis]
MIATHPRVCQNVYILHELKKAKFAFGFFLCVFGIWGIFAAQIAHANVIHPRQASPNLAPSSFPQASDVLAKVVSALKHTNYRGRITYEQNGKLEVMEVSHAVIGGLEYEKIYFLNGDDRELAKQGKSVGCQSMGDKLLSGMPINLSSGNFAALEKSYRMAVIGEDRVAGRSAWVLQMLPADEYRHGVIYTIDKSSYIPLKTMYVSSSRKVLERLHFVSLDTDVSFKVEDFPGSTEYSNTRCKRDKTEMPQGESQWKPSWVPPGFVLSAYSFTEEDGHIETYTDGLASFTVIIKPLQEQVASANFSTNLRKGATIILLRHYGSAQMPIQASLLGEIPSDVAGRILSSVKPVQ